MHEMSIAMELMRQLESLAAEHGFERIETLTVSAGAMRGIVPEALEAAFEAVAEGTCAADASLNLEVVAPVARCRPCGQRFDPKVDEFVCGRCGKADVEIVEGNEIILTSVTGQQAQGATRDED